MGVKARTRSAWALFALTRIAGVFIDLAVLALAYVSAFALRFDFAEPRWGWRTVAYSFITVSAIHLCSLIICNCYRLPWRRTRLAELPWYVLSIGLAVASITVLRFFTPIEEYMHLRPPYSVNLMSALMALAGVFGWRVLWSWVALRLSREEALLSRAIKEMDSTAAIDFLRGKTVMVTGAGGSIGSELVRQVVMASPSKLLMVERCENALYEIDREIRRLGTEVPVRPLMVDINDRDRMVDLFTKFKPEIVLHAAAYKHVPMVEINPDEGWRNNTEATRQLAELSRQFGVQRFVMISTDKAVNPVSVMGKTKRAAEKAIMAMNGDDGTSFCAVRFGNVLGSSGSVVPLFRMQIARKEPITVTDPGMKRYFMTVSEAVGLVLQAASRQEKAIYTLDMGAPVKILDLAEEMIRQAGYKPYVDIPIKIVGIRPGEKLFEELDISEKSAYKTDMAKIYITKVES